jgi:two-component sensor histidine kinase
MQIRFTLHCEVYDNGIGFDENSEESKNKGAGLKLIQTKIKIVEEVLNQRIGYSFANYYDDVGVKQGTRTEFVFPVVYPKNKD